METVWNSHMAKGHMVAECCSLAPYSRDSLKTAQLVHLQPKPRPSTIINPRRNPQQITTL